jgi:hypothetical protein
MVGNKRVALNHHVIVKNSFYTRQVDNTWLCYDARLASLPGFAHCRKCLELCFYPVGLACG